MSGNFSPVFDGVKISLLTVEEQNVLKAYFLARKTRARREDELMDNAMGAMLPDAPCDFDSAHKSSLAEASLAQAIEAEKKALAAWRRVRLGLRGDKLATAVETGMENFVATVEGGVDGVRRFINDGPVGGFFDGLRGHRPGKSADSGSGTPSA